MSLSYYIDVHVHGGITKGLRNRQVVVLRAQDDGMGTAPDPALLDRALALGYVLFTQDVDLLAEAARRQRAGEAFAGVISAHQIHVTVGQCIADLELLAKVYDPVDMMNKVEYLPL